jgi:hypothetical protein
MKEENKRGLKGLIGLTATLGIFVITSIIIDNSEKEKNKADDFIRLYTVEKETYHPAKQITVEIGGTPKIVLYPIEIMNYQTVVFYIHNISTNNSFTDVDIQVSANNIYWSSLPFTVCDKALHDEGCNYKIENNAYRYVRVLVSGSDEKKVSAEAQLIATNPKCSDEKSTEN